MELYEGKIMLKGDSITMKIHCFADTCSEAIHFIRAVKPANSAIMTVRAV